jgi:anti-sigma B factor antagonist
MKTSTSSDLERDPGLRIEQVVVDDHVVVRVAGEIDVYTAPRLREQLIRLVGSGSVIVDLDEVTFLDSTALGVLVGALKRQRDHGGTFSVVASGNRVRRLFDITGLTRVFPFYKSVTEATSETGETPEA